VLHPLHSVRLASPLIHMARYVVGPPPPTHTLPNALATPAHTHAPTHPTHTDTHTHPYTRTPINLAFTPFSRRVVTPDAISNLSFT
jgi:hypothetical protein